VVLEIALHVQVERAEHGVSSGGAAVTGSPAPTRDEARRARQAVGGLAAVARARGLGVVLAGRAVGANGRARAAVFAVAALGARSGARGRGRARSALEAVGGVGVGVPAQRTARRGRVSSGGRVHTARSLRHIARTCPRGSWSKTSPRRSRRRTPRSTPRRTWLQQTRRKSPRCTWYTRLPQTHCRCQRSTGCRKMQTPGCRSQHRSRCK
jgi:hypothetical protein